MFFAEHHVCCGARLLHGLPPVCVHSTAISNPPFPLPSDSPPTLACCPVDAQLLTPPPPPPIYCRPRPIPIAPGRPRPRRRFDPAPPCVPCLVCSDDGSGVPVVGYTAVAASRNTVGTTTKLCCLPHHSSLALYLPSVVGAPRSPFCLASLTPLPIPVVRCFHASGWPSSFVLPLETLSFVFCPPVFFETKCTRVSCSHALAEEDC